MRTSTEILTRDFARAEISETLASPRVQSHWQLDQDGKLVLRWCLGSFSRLRGHTVGDAHTGTLTDQRA
jgi:hypothetical protein